MRGIGALALILAAAPAHAAEPAPGYFVDAVFETTTAQALARGCAALSVDPIAAARVTEDVLGRLTADGFTPETLAERMDDPADAIAERQAAFLARHELADGAPEAAVCAAGRAEIAEATPLGALLVEVAP
ncbi:DUF5333 domain-containing protein [Jannaschia sp. W003]|uniref:DUF5333 domain-containing protein n=1 Tax=Jannaschia sp. W003 TaxID=2867012 RepID=UPI0021A66328|nr:DUF5333 domain-containing protein [Jannaschia sp. W003]UWQ22835.1 DUF5333 domain-containing protein [Jannaschia sp. W003]